MQIVIDIPEDSYERVMNPDKFYRDIDGEKIRWAVYKGTVLPEHGRLIDADALFNEFCEIACEPYINVPTILEAWGSEE